MKNPSCELNDADLRVNCHVLWHAPLGGRACAAALIAAWLSASGCASPDAPGFGDDSTTARKSAIHVNPGSTISKATEGNSTTGRYSEVLYVAVAGRCTGTVVGPYAVLTANHCTNGVDNPRTFSGNVGWNESFPAVTNVYINPYLDPSYTPDWWIALNEAEKARPGGRQDDWPAQHDQALLFVPSLTPEFLRANAIAAMAIDPAATATDHTLVGVGSTLGQRDSVPAKFVAANPETISTWPRDGYITLDGSTANFGIADPGDSGGPSLGSSIYPWTGGQTIEVNRFVTGTSQNPQDRAPLAYNIGIAMTGNQTLTVRLNAHWARARIDDIDGDGLPTACDSDPSNGNGSIDLCPNGIGGPTNVTSGIPFGLLECKRGYLPVGLLGRAGSLIDQLALKCQAYSCLNRFDVCTDEYVTDAFGGTGGGAWSEQCATGSVLVGAAGMADNSLIYSLGGVCAPLSKVNAGTATVNKTALPVQGAGASGSSYSFDCGDSSMLTGFQAKTSDKRWVTGLKPICRPTGHRFGAYAGGTSGGVASQSCPPSEVAIGTVQRAENGSVNLFGVLCASQSTVMNQSATIPDSAITLVRSGYVFFAAGLGVPPMVEPLTTAHLPPDTVRKRCPTGYALTTVNSFSTNLINRISSIVCRDIRPGGGQTQTISVGVGNAVGSLAGSTCPTGKVANGLFTRSGWLTDGLALQCRNR